MVSERVAPWLIVLVLLATATSALAQFDDGQQHLPNPIPPPLPKQPPPAEALNYEGVLGDSDTPWGLDAELLVDLSSKVALYEQYSRKFTCDETARLADYNASGEIDDEKTRRYGYLLQRDRRQGVFRELRQTIGKSGELKKGEVVDGEPFPPAYAWIFMFGKFHEPHFSFRRLDTDFDGFDLVHTIEFRGSKPFSDGRDIREWEGRVTVDAFTLTPLEIRAEPANQKAKIEELYRQWNQSFSILGFKTKKPPLIYRAHVQFRHKRDGLTFPTELRYDTKKAVSPQQVIAVKASTRTYRNYLFTGVETQEKVEPASP